MSMYDGSVYFNPYNGKWCICRLESEFLNWYESYYGPSIWVDERRAELPIADRFLFFNISSIGNEPFYRMCGVKFYLNSLQEGNLTSMIHDCFKLLEDNY